MSTRRSARTAAKVGEAQENGVENAKSKGKKRATVNSEDDVFKVPEIPQTPPPKRRKPGETTLIQPPPLTPTPSAVAVIAHTDNSSPQKTPAKRRRAAPNVTNAPLQTPGGSRIVKYPSDLFDAAGSQEGSGHQSSQDRVTTDNLLERACQHLCSVDPRLQAVIDKHHCKLFSPEGLQEDVEPFQALSSGIMAQQVSGAAASSIKKKFVGLFFEDVEPSDKKFPTPAQVVEKDIATLRTAGLSQRKAEYIHGLAEKFVAGDLSAQMLVEASDEEVLEKLVAVRGLGRWSVEMFACFALKRTDIFSTGDLGVQRGMAAYIGKDVAKLKNKGGKWKYMSEADMVKIAEPFAPYRSLFMWYMWRIEDVNLDALS